MRGKYRTLCGSEDEKIIDICGHKWQIVDTRWTHSGPTYKLEDVIKAGGHTPHIARNNVE